MYLYLFLRLYLSVSQEGSVSGRISNIEITPPPSDVKSEFGSSTSRKGEKVEVKKKTSWFNFYPSYKSRSEDFKRLFKEVPDDERLVVDYSCAVQKEILVQGRLYVTQNYLCFHANIFGWETNLTLKWKDVASITKEKTALVIPNAVLISTKTEKYFFTSFVARDKTYLMLFRVWQNALMDQPMPAQEMWQWVHQCYGSELGLTSDDEDYIAPVTEDEKLSARLSVDSFVEDNIIGDGSAEHLNMDHKGIKGANPMKHKMNGSDSQVPTDVTDNSESDVEKPIKYFSVLAFQKKSFPPFPKREFLLLKNPNNPRGPMAVHFWKIKSDINPYTLADINVRCTSSHEGRQLLNEVVPIHIDQLFTLLFTSSKFYLDFHAARKTTDLTQTPWTHNPLDNSKSRVVNLTVALSQTMGPKTAQVTRHNKAGSLYSIDVDTLNAGIPYADSFCVIIHYCLQRYMHKLGIESSVWGVVKGMIERNAWAGLDDFFTHLIRGLSIEGEENIPDIKRKSRRKRRLHSIPRIGLQENNIRTEMYFSDEENTQVVDFLVQTHVPLIVFFILVLLLLLNVVLYYKLWSLEETPPYTLLDLHVLKNPPKSQEEWVKLLQQQEALHTLEAHKWQRILKASIELLKQAEESLANYNAPFTRLMLTNLCPFYKTNRMGKKAKRNYICTKMELKNYDFDYNNNSERNIQDEQNI
ncbi:hypothetical protein NQ317_000569 [Molorchus minor]|uniref:VASt domain-containing protein n=1 Tax=Molorchus minor TaxID=1323400 RepID=A0ABQ9J0C0_9CUCU|nr:hypothetical protein NQ317_000569 [Molorchus minor]